MKLPGPLLVPDPQPTLPVTRRRHQFDFNDPLETFNHHCGLVMWSRRAAYVGPRVVVTCDRPTPGFWRAVYAEKGAWFRVARHFVFPRDWLEDPKKWRDPVFPGAPLGHLQEHRKACVTGAVYLYTTEVRPRYWPSPEEVGYRPRPSRKRKPSDRTDPIPTREADPNSITQAPAHPDWRLHG